MTEAVTIASEKRLAQVAVQTSGAPDVKARLAGLTERIRSTCDTRPVGKIEWDAACGDEA